MPLGMEVGLNPGAQFSAHVYCGQTAGCIKIPLAMEVGLSPGDFVLDGDPAPLPKKGAEPPIFGPCLLWPNGWMDQDATWYEGRPRPRRMVTQPLRPKQGHTPQFSPMSIVGKRLYVSGYHLVRRQASAQATLC